MPQQANNNNKKQTTKTSELDSERFLKHPKLYNLMHYKRPLGCLRAASPWRTLGIRSCWTFLFRHGLIANALTQCSS